MRTLLILIALTCPALAQFSNFTAVPTHPTPGIVLNWTGPAGSVGVNRWTDLNPAPVQIGTSSTGTFTDTTPVANTIYYYNVSQGAPTSKTFTAVVSDITQPFVCPFIQPVSQSLIGVDRTVTYQTPRGSNSFTVHAPVTTSTVSISPCNGGGGCDDRTNINAAIANGVKINLSVGTYVLNIPNAGTPFGLNYNLHNDVTISGVRSGVQPPTAATDTIIQINLPPSGDSPYWIAIPGGSRNMLQKVVLVGNYVNAIPGTVTTSGGNQIFTITNNPTWYVPNGASPPKMYSSTGYTLANGAYKIATGGRPGVPGTFNTNWAVDNLYFYTVTGIVFPNPQGAIAWVNQSNTAPTIPREAIHLADDKDFTLADVDIYGAAGGGIQRVDISATDSGGLWIVNSKIGKKPSTLLQPGEPAAVVGLFGDNDVNGTTGRILIESNDFGFIDDDIFALQGGFAHQAASIVSTSEATFTAVINHAINANDVFNFYDPQTLSFIGSATAASWTQIAGTIDVTFATPIPGLAKYIGLSAPATPFGTEPLYGNPNFLIRNNCFHDTYGHLAVLAGSHGSIESNVYGNGAPQSMVLSWFPKGQPTVGYQDVRFDSNKVIGPAYSQLDTNWLGNSTFGLETGAPSFGIGLNSVAWPVSPSTTSLVPIQGVGSAFGGYGNSGIEITNNFLSNIPGLCVLVSGANNVGVGGNICVDGNAVPFTAGYQAANCGPDSVGIPIVTTPICQQYVAAQQAFMVTHSTNVDTTSQPNTCLGTTTSCVFLDTTANPGIVGSRFIQ